MTCGGSVVYRHFRCDEQQPEHDEDNERDDEANH
jgi:hypothetical protein